mgnify:CR=1 FL=1
MNYDPDSYWKPIAPVETEKPEKLIPKAEPEPEFPALTEMESKPVGDWEVKLTFWQKIQAALKIIDLLQTIRGFNMGNWKTTTGAIIAGLATVLQALGIVEMPPEVQTGIISVALFIVGLFAKDSTPKDE